MTLLCERENAIISAHALLVDLLCRKGPIRKKDLRLKIRRVLKHYPSAFEMQRMYTLSHRE